MQGKQKEHKFRKSCLVHSHSRSQTSVYLSSMEAMSLLTEAIYLKQVLRFFVNDFGGLGDQEKVMMRLRLDSTSAQAFFSRLGPGKAAKHLSTRLLWTQQAMRKQWFYVDRKSTKENPADLNTKALSKERREFLMKRSGLKNQHFEENDDVVCSGKKKQLVKLLVNMIVASNLQGCEEAQAGVRTTSWILTWAFCGDHFSFGFGDETFSQADEQDGRAGEVQVCSEDSERGNDNERGR